MTVVEISFRCSVPAVLDVLVVATGLDLDVLATGLADEGTVRSTAGRTSGVTWL